MIDPDRPLVLEVKAGDTESFRHLVDRHKGRVYGMLMSLVADEDVAEELAQETFVKAFTGISDFREDASFGTWVLQIAIHSARDYRRRAQRLRNRRVVSLEGLREAHRQSLEAVDTARAANPAAALESREETDLVRRAMATLPPPYREVVILKHLEGWSYEAIAASTGDSVGTLKVRAHRARRLLRDALAELGWGGLKRVADTPNPADPVSGGKERDDG